MLAPLVNAALVPLAVQLLLLSLAGHLPSTDQLPVRGGQAVAKLRGVTVSPIAAGMPSTNIGGESDLVPETRLVKRSVHEAHRGRKGQEKKAWEE